MFFVRNSQVIELDFKLFLFIMSTSRDNVLWRRTFSRGKSDGTLGTVRWLVWMYRVGALAFAGYFSYRDICSLLAEDGLLYLIVLDMIFYLLVVLAHVVAIGLTIPIMRWRQKWVDGRPAFHPDNVFVYFTGASLIGTIILLVLSVFLLGTGGIRAGGGILAVSFVGALFVVYFANRIWSINIHQPSGGRVNQPTVQNQPPIAPYPGYTPVSAPQPGTHQAYASPAVQSGGYQAPPPLASYTGYNAAPAVNGGAPPPLASYTGAPATTAPPYYPPYNAAPAPSPAAQAQPAVQLCLLMPLGGAILPSWMLMQWMSIHTDGRMRGFPLFFTFLDLLNCFDVCELLHKSKDMSAETLMKCLPEQPDGRKALESYLIGSSSSTNASKASSISSARCSARMANTLPPFRPPTRHVPERQLLQSGVVFA
ncbi:hypothetical protein BJ742DRAFT_745976 [Cladochytrium replicatum]|nr:hypothetical protein BJ742DRAFT_745976 [Cladochytrium replicatum]